MMFPRLIRRTLGVAGAALAGFHGWLFAGQAAAGRLDDPWLILRWGAAALVVGALVAVHRGGRSIWGRSGIAIWVLAALLHGPAVAGTAGIDSIALPETVATSIVQLLSSAALAVGLWRLVRRSRSRSRAGAAITTLLSTFSACGPLAAGITTQFSPRPPPLRG